MMLATILLFASAQIHETEIPAHFRDGNVRAYVNCLRSEVNSGNEPWRDPDPAAPTIVRFGQLVTHCSVERSQAASSLRGFIQTRHPDWSPAQVGEGVEFVLTGIDLEMMAAVRRPIDDGTHAPPRERF